MRRDGRRCLPIYVWTFPEAFEAAHTIEVVLVIDSGGEVRLESFPIVYYPFHVEQLTECLTAAGFRDVRYRWSENKAGYRAIAS